MPTGGTPAFSGGTVSGTVALAPNLVSRVGPTDVLYVIARDSATRTVAAVKRIDKPTFPVAFELGASDSMGGGTKAGGPFEITARLSKSGDAIPSAGDLEGQRTAVAFGAKGVSITIDAVRK
jgi:cytochrome c-type biogenesis protein CcmH